jgi:hypothetical protein
MKKNKNKKGEKMLKSIGGDRIKEVPHKKELEKCKQRLTHNEIEKIKEELGVLLNEKYNHVDPEERIVTSSWIPGKTWEGTPYQVIYEKGAECNEGLAAGYFGLLLMETVIEREGEEWIFMKAESETVKGSYYFRNRS